MSGRGLNWRKANLVDRMRLQGISVVEPDGTRSPPPKKRKPRKKRRPPLKNRKKALFNAYVGYLRGNLTHKPNIQLPLETKREIWEKAQQHHQATKGQPSRRRPHGGAQRRIKRSSSAKQSSMKG